MKLITFFDLEIDANGNIAQSGVVVGQTKYHGSSVTELVKLLNRADYLAGHNIVQHDYKVLKKKGNALVINKLKLIDTLYLSPLCFPKKPYHRLVKDYKLRRHELNNPLSDSLLAQIVLQDEVAAFREYDVQLQQILYQLLHDKVGFAGFFDYLAFAKTTESLESLFSIFFDGKLCANVDLNRIIQLHPIELAYSLVIIQVDGSESITPSWVFKQFPKVSQIICLLRNKPCIQSCNYCDERLDGRKGLKNYFGFDEFRLFDGKRLQEKVVNLGLLDKSLLVVFPTGGGKSLTFQIPALMSGRNTGGLTVIISPLQSLMKDQVDNLERKGITNAVTINGLLDPIERAKAIERVNNGNAWLLYISPESLRSKTISNLLMGRKIIRFVIDEAHCFSSWGQDFRVDYLYIGDFIRKLQKEKQLDEAIPVSCFTATAKPNVIADIQSYFKEKLYLDLELIRANSQRTNLEYEVLEPDKETDKFITLRKIITDKDCPTIVYVSRTRTAEDLSDKLVECGIDARPFHGKMDSKVKTKNQDDFIAGHVQVMVATSAFGMGVDKDNVKLVVHYEISNSLENYVQEAGRAGRDPNIEAKCIILFSEEDLHKHFVLLTQTKINIKEIQQIWKSIKDLTKFRKNITSSALEIARNAGWNDEVRDLETRVRTAINALEQAGFVERQENSPRVYADSIGVKTAQEAIDIINKSKHFGQKQRENSIRIIKKLFSQKSHKSITEEGESRLDYLVDLLGIVKGEAIDAIQLMRKEKILADDTDLVAFVERGKTNRPSVNRALEYADIEKFIQPLLFPGGQVINIKEWSEKATSDGFQGFTVHRAMEILNIWAILGLIKKHTVNGVKHSVSVVNVLSEKEFMERQKRRHYLMKFIIEYLYTQALRQNEKSNEKIILVEFSLLELEKAYKKKQELFKPEIGEKDIRDSLLYLSRIKALTLEGGFLVLYNRMKIERKEDNSRIGYKKVDYKQLEQFYKNKIEQIHLVGEYAKKMINNYEEALKFVNDYFTLNYNLFLRKYFDKTQLSEMSKSITPKKFKQLFGELSPIQLNIVKDAEHPHIGVLAGPGSGKTKVLVHKLTSLLLLEDVKHEQLLMLTFSRAAATEFKKRLFELLGGAAAFVEIKTFHSYCFDLLGKVGNVDKSDTVLAEAIEKIQTKDVKISQIAKTVLVIDEAQDMSEEEFLLVGELMKFNENMKVIMVGDDDQNIYTFRGSNSSHLERFVKNDQTEIFHLLKNYRSKSNIVDFANQFVTKITKRLKTHPNEPFQKENGGVRLFTYKSNYLMIPLVDELLKTELKGTTCILTKTNKQAELIMSRLIINDLPAKLIQTNDSFSLLDLQEIRYFLKHIKKNDSNNYVDAELWGEAKRSLFIKYKESPNFHLVKQLIIDFQETNPKEKYLADLRVFIKESKMEDFLLADNELIYVSTMHKSKGKEFDNVIILLENKDMHSDDEKRLIYVALTRAKNDLTIHTNGSIFDDIKVPELQRFVSRQQYPEPNQLLINTSLRDVNLGFFKKHQVLIKKKLSAGMELHPTESGLMYAGVKVLEYSKSFRLKLKEKSNNNYLFLKANIQHLVFWRDKNEVATTYETIIDGKLSSSTLTQEVLVVLVTIRLKKTK